MSPLHTKNTEVFVFKLKEDDDLFLSIKNLAQENEITSAMFYLIGAVKKAKFAFYEGGTYKHIEMNEPMEILSCIGNIATNEQELIMHAHVSFGNSEGNAFGGHLIEGSIIDPLGELFIFELKDDLKRIFDPKTNLTVLDL